MGEKRVPIGIKVVSIINYLVMLLLIVGAILMFINPGLIFSELLIFAEFGFSQVFVYYGVYMLLFAVLFFFIGRGLWKGQKWARVVAIIFAILFFLDGLSVFRGFSLNELLRLFFGGAISGYLLFAKEVKQFFA